jgi:hypothetical protein
MTYRSSFLGSLLAVLAIAVACSTAGAQTYSGQAFAGGVTIDVFGQPVVTTNALDTGDLPSTGGGPITQSSVGLIALPGGVLTLGDRTVSTSGLGDTSMSSASVNSLNVGALGISDLVTAGVITANTSATCPGEVLTGSSDIANLTVDGDPITVTGDPNQTVQITVPGVADVTVVINEQILLPRSITVNALHITIDALDGLTDIDVIVVSARSGINCALAPTVDLYSGRGTAVRVGQGSLLVPELTTIIADTGWLPSPGTAPDPPITSTTAGAGLAPILTTGTAFSSTEGGDPVGTTASSSQVEDLEVTLANLPLSPDILSLTADVIESNTECTCSLTVPTCTGDSTLVGLTASVLGVPVDIPVDLPPNTTLIDVNIPLVADLLVVVNEQSSFSVGTYEEITVNALHIELGVLTALLVDTDIVVAHAHSDIVCGVEPTAAGATIAGRVTAQDGRGLGGASISISDSDGTVWQAITNPFGYYTLENVTVGQTYVMEASHRRYSFSPRVVTVDGDLAGVDFIPDGGTKP